jgi:hypothetical protein
MQAQLGHIVHSGKSPFHSKFTTIGVLPLTLQMNNSAFSFNHISSSPLPTSFVPKWIPPRSLRAPHTTASSHLSSQRSIPQQAYTIARQPAETPNRPPTPIRSSFAEPSARALGRDSPPRSRMLDSERSGAIFERGVVLCWGTGLGVGNVFSPVEVCCEILELALVC